MKELITDLVFIIGLASLTTGVYLLYGLAVTLMVLGLMFLLAALRCGYVNTTQAEPPKPTLTTGANHDN